MPKRRIAFEFDADQLQAICIASLNMP